MSYKLEKIMFAKHIINRMLALLQNKSKGKNKMPTKNPYAYRIEGGYPVIGEITCLGTKNFGTKAMVAALLGDTPTALNNMPPIGDVDLTAEMLTSIHVGVQRIDSQRLIIDPTSIRTSTIPTPHSGSNRLPILLLSALLHRFDKVS